VAGSCEYGDEQSGSGTTEIVIYVCVYIYIGRPDIMEQHHTP
jgi:hypothetical protein